MENFMLVSNQFFEVRWHYTNKEYYESKGYEFTKFGDIFCVKGEDLNPTSHQMVLVKCDGADCGKIMRRSFRRYVQEHDHEFDDTCKKCNTQKKIRTNKEKYGTEWALQTEESKQKQRDTCLRIFGVEYASQDKNFRHRVIQTCREKYGVDNVSMVPEIREKAANSFYENGTCPTSRPQMKLNEMLAKEYGKSELNYPCGKYSLDSMIEIKGQKIDVEFDGKFWHESKQEKDKKRNEFLIAQGYKILRVISCDDLPSIELVRSSIKQLLETDKNLIIINMMK